MKKKDRDDLILAYNCFHLSPHRCLAAADPGLKGGISFLFSTEVSGRKLITYPMPVKNGVVDTLALSKIIGMYKPERVFIEEMFTGKKSGPDTIAIMGKNWGRLAAAYECHKIPITTVHASSWQAKMLTKRVEKGDTKARALAASKVFFPRHDFSKVGKSTKECDGQIDAALLNLYGAFNENILTGN